MSTRPALHLVIVFHTPENGVLRVLLPSSLAMYVQYTWLSVFNVILARLDLCRNFSQTAFDAWKSGKSFLWRW